MSSPAALLLLLFVLLSGATTNAARAHGRLGKDAEARALKLVSLPDLGALDWLTSDDPSSHCKVPVLPGGASAAFAKRIDAFRAEYGDAARWTAAVLERVGKREEHSELLRKGKPFTPVEGEDDEEDAAFGAYLRQLDLLRQQVEAESPEDGNTWRARLRGFVAKDRFKYKIEFVGYARDGESARKLYEQLETSVKRFGQADAITFWDKESVLRHHEEKRKGGGSNQNRGGAMRRVYERDPEYGGGAWKPAIILAALERAKYGDFVVYADTSHIFNEAGTAPAPAPAPPRPPVRRT